MLYICSGTSLAVHHQFLVTFRYLTLNLEMDQKIYWFCYFCWKNLLFSSWVWSQSRNSFPSLVGRSHSYFVLQNLPLTMNGKLLLHPHSWSLGHLVTILLISAANTLAPANTAWHIPNRDSCKPSRVFPASCQSSMGNCQLRKLMQAKPWKDVQYEIHSWFWKAQGSVPET